MFPPLAPRGKLLIAFVLFLLAASTLAFPGSAQAALGGCRSDPVVVLSDGTTVDVTAAIDANLWDVTSVRYVVHGPPGVRMIAVVRTPSLFAKEYFTYVDDAEPGQYITETLVQVKGNPVQVTSQTTLLKATLLGGLKVALQHAPIPGWSGETLTAVLEP